MKKLARILFLFILIALSSGQDLISPLALSENTGIQYIANEGFLLKMKGKKVVIDMPFDGAGLSWCEGPSPETIKRLTQAVPPFNAIDAFVFTHDHVDHFNPELVKQCLLSNPKAALIGTHLVLKRVKEIPGKELGNPMFEAVAGSKIEWAGLAITVLSAPHAPYGDIDPKTGIREIKRDGYVHVAYLISDGHTQILHGGDALDIHFSASGDKDKYIALALFDRGILRALGIEGLKKLKAEWKIKKVGLMHLNPDNIEPIRTMIKDQGDWLMAFSQSR